VAWSYVPSWWRDRVRQDVVTLAVSNAPCGSWLASVKARGRPTKLTRGRRSTSRPLDVQTVVIASRCDHDARHRNFVQLARPVDVVGHERRTAVMLALALHEVGAPAGRGGPVDDPHAAVDALAVDHRLAGFLPSVTYLARSLPRMPTRA